MRDVKHITSHANPEIKRIRALALRKNREEEGVFVAEGLRHALEAADAGWEIETLVLEKAESDNPSPKLRALMDACLARGGGCLSVTRDVMERLTRRDNAQAVVSIIRQEWRDLAAVTPGAGDIWLALEEIRDPGNLGTIIRTADAGGASGIFLIGNTCDPYAMESVRASMGSFPRVALCRCTLDDFIGWAGKNPALNIVGTHLATPHDYRDGGYGTPLVLAMGNEQAGLSDRLAGACTRLVKIPMAGRADSLNVSVAAGIALFEAVRLRASA